MEGGAGRVTVVWVWVGAAATAPQLVSTVVLVTLHGVMHGMPQVVPLTKVNLTMYEDDIRSGAGRNPLSPASSNAHTDEDPDAWRVVVGAVVGSAVGASLVLIAGAMWYRRHRSGHSSSGGLVSSSSSDEFKAGPLENFKVVGHGDDNGHGHLGDTEPGDDAGDDAEGGRGRGSDDDV